MRNTFCAFLFLHCDPAQSICHRADQDNGRKDGAQILDHEKEYIEIKHKYDLLEEMAQTMTDPDNVDINAFLTLDLEMHAIWFCSMNKWYIWQNLTKPQPDYSRFTRLDVVRANNVPDVLSEHREILRVIREKDLDAIEPLIRRHLYGGLRRMGTQLYAEKYRSYFTGI